ncbi:MAG: TetR/AcrR family transcriptional regulator [Fibrobacteria bacterium]|nr:TetR/AcrR family transcriptional regulator [Fibrobacteria bacterium]
MPKKKNPDIKNDILKAAIDLFGRYGYKKTTVDEIAEAANIGKGTVYLNFSTKEDILFTIIKENAEKMLKKLKSELRKKEDIKEKLRLILHWRPERVFEFNAKYHHAMELMPVKKDLVKRIGAGPLKTYIAILTETLDEGNASGVFMVKDTALLAEHINFMCFAFMPPFRIYETKEQVLEQVEEYYKLLLKSIEKK